MLLSFFAKIERSLDFLSNRCIIITHCIHRLMALEGAIPGVKKTMLSDEVKAEMKEFYQRNKR